MITIFQLLILDYNVEKIGIYLSTNILTIVIYLIVSDVNNFYILF